MSGSALNFVDGVDPVDPGAGRNRLYSKAGQWWFFPGGGVPHLLGETQPAAFAYSSNPGTVVVSTTPNNVVDTRLVAAGVLVPDQILEATIRVFLTGTNNTKSLLVGIDADLTSALAVVFAAGQVGIATITAEFLVAHTGNSHELISRADFNSGYALGGLKRAATAVNLNTTAINLLTEAWVANAADSITIDSIMWRLMGNGL